MSTSRWLPLAALGLSCQGKTAEPNVPVELCPFAAGEYWEDTHPELPAGAAIAIEHVIVVMQENRSFDHYFQLLPAGGGPDVDVAPPGAGNRALLGEEIPFHAADTPCLGAVPHSWNDVHAQIADGTMTGFVEQGGREAMTYYSDEWLPFYYGLGRTFSVADRYFASVPGPTWPNRMFMLAGSSFGHIRNQPPPARDEEYSIFDQLEEAGESWAIYTASAPSFEEQIFPALRAEKPESFRTLDDFFVAAESGDLPSFSWVTSGGGDNEHPPKSVQTGQRYVAGVVEAVLRSPSWPSVALFFTYDEHGGFYDHVPPPPACPPDDIAPERSADDVAGGFDRLGVRVPMVLVSPYARQGFVSHTVYDHTSILRFVQARFHLTAMSGRDAHAVAPLEMFDFDAPPFLTPPELPPAVEDPNFVGKCPDGASTDVDNGAPSGP